MIACVCVWEWGWCVIVGEQEGKVEVRVRMEGKLVWWASYNLLLDMLIAISDWLMCCFGVDCSPYKASLQLLFVAKQSILRYIGCHCQILSPPCSNVLFVCKVFVSSFRISNGAIRDLPRCTMLLVATCLLCWSISFCGFCGFFFLLQVSWKFGYEVANKFNGVFYPMLVGS